MSSSIPLKEFAEVWSSAANLYDKGKFLEAAQQFETVAADSTAKISYNLGCIYLKLKQHEKSLENFQKAVTKDTHFVAAYVQMAAIYLEYNICDAAIKCYQVAIHLMGNKKYINYRPLGLNLILYLTEALHNQAVAESKVDNWKQVEILINMAISAQQEDKFNNKLKISLQAIQQKQQPQQFPIGTGIFHPPKWMIESTKNVNYLGDSKVISTNNNPFSMNESNSRSKSSNDELWPNLKERETGQKKEMKTVIELLTTITLDTAIKTVNSKQKESNLGTDGKPQRPPRPQSKSPPLRPPLPPRISEIRKLPKLSTNNDLKSQDNTKAPRAEYKEVGRTVFVKYSLLSSNPNILTVRQGDKIVVKALGADWFQGCLKNKIGLVPWNCIHQR
ncbi:neutrophil cytosol factor 2 [Octopus sinensis]|uniref:Neutrophil cytosol factor 2 n=1 Tax=Octopus sinensis TaxID=2607531 RepID=A0A6P7TCU7_9MOLL|nr:neutrophil cytosol factor 2 [Octopus sinensis]